MKYHYITPLDPAYPATSGTGHLPVNQSMPVPACRQGLQTKLRIISNNQIQIPSPLLMTWMAVALKETLTSLPSVKDNSSRE